MPYFPYGSIYLSGWLTRHGPFTSGWRWTRGIILTLATPRLHQALLKITKFLKVYLDPHTFIILGLNYGLLPEFHLLDRQTPLEILLPPGGTRDGPIELILLTVIIPFFIFNAL